MTLTRAADEMYVPSRKLYHADEPAVRMRTRTNMKQAMPCLKFWSTRHDHNSALHRRVLSAFGSRFTVPAQI